MLLLQLLLLLQCRRKLQLKLPVPLLCCFQGQPCVPVLVLHALLMCLAPVKVLVHENPVPATYKGRTMNGNKQTPAQT